MPFLQHSLFTSEAMRNPTSQITPCHPYLLAVSAPFLTWACTLLSLPNPSTIPSGLMICHQQNLLDPQIIFWTFSSSSCSPNWNVLLPSQVIFLSFFLPYLLQTLGLDVGKVSFLLPTAASSSLSFPFSKLFQFIWNTCHLAPSCSTSTFLSFTFLLLMPPHSLITLTPVFQSFHHCFCHHFQG